MKKNYRYADPYTIKYEQEIKFVHGIGKKKSELQKAVEELESYIERMRYLRPKNTGPTSENSKI